ncbi:MAG: hypothetical protein H0X07_00100 [Gemmatimonadales bacterium]|nr:hypothetical protein [Gemmatimonadales bacterium]
MGDWKSEDWVAIIAALGAMITGIIAALKSGSASRKIEAHEIKAEGRAKLAHADALRVTEECGDDKDEASGFNQVLADTGILGRRAGWRPKRGRSSGSKGQGP